MVEPRWRVLIADDNPDDRALIKGALLRGSVARAFRFVEVGSVAEALARVRGDAEPYQALLVDYTLPDGTAFDLLAGLPREPEGPGLLPLLLPAPVVVVTGRGEGELGARLLRAGATDFVGKDWLGPGSVTRAVENAIERFAMATELRQRQRALRESESRSRTIFEHATTGIAIIDAGGHYLRCNAAYSAITGLSEEELRHREFPALLHAEERERSRAHMQLLLAGAIPSYELDGRFIRQDGSVRWVHKFVSVLDVEDGRPHELISLVTDVTARRAAEAELRERDDAARLVADTAARLVLGNAGGGSTEEVLSSTFRELCRRVDADCYLHYTLETDGALQLVSSVGVDLAAHPGVTRVGPGEYLCGQVLARAMPLVLEEQELAECEAALPGLRAYAGYPIAAEDRVFGVLAFASRRRGRFRTTELDLIATLADLVAAWMDRARLTRALREREERLALFIAHAPAGLAMFDRDMRYLAASRRYLGDFGLDGDQLIGRAHYEVFPALPAAWHEAHRRALAGEVVTSPGERYQAPGGEVRWVRWEARPWIDGQGEVGGIILATEDITARRRMEDELARERERVLASVQRVRLLADAMPQLVWVADDTGELEYVSQRAREYRGAAAGPGGRLEWQPRLHLDDRERTAGAWAEAVAAGQPFSCEHRLAMADGCFRWHLSRGIPVVDPATQVRTWYGTATDIHELRETQEVARARLGELTATYDTAPVGLCVLDRDLRFVRINRRLAEINGLPVEAHLGRTVAELLPDLLPSVRDVAERVFAGEPVLGFELRGTTPAVPGVERTWVESWYPLRDAAGAVVGINIVAGEVTEERRLTEELRLHREELQRLVEERTEELEASHRRLRVSERMASLGTLSAGLGHDMGNLLMPLRVRLDTLQALDLPLEVQRELDGIRASATYLQRLASGLRLLAVDPQQAAQERALEVARWWREAEAVLRNILPRGTLLEAALPDEPTWVRISAPALTQAVFNLVQNAGDALKGLPPGIVTVAIRPCGAEVVVRVSDTGPGMNAEVQQRCMEPFFTTKARGISTGLGLALVYGLVQESGGVVELESAPGKGATFTLRLPRAEPPPGRGAPGRSAYVGMGNPRLRAYVAAHLRQRGCEVQAGPDAVRTADLLVVEGEAPPGARGRVITLPTDAPFGDVKQALRAALEELDTPMVTT